MVKSAGEAVQLIHARMGEKARVLSVKQVEGEGLARFLSAPKLEVIAHVPVEESAAPAASADTSAKAAVAEMAAEAAQGEVASSPDGAESEKSSPAEAKISEKDAPARKKVPAQARAATRRGLESTLRSAGFSAEVLHLLERSPRWSEIEQQPLPQAISAVVGLLREGFRNLPQRALTHRVAFLGTAGVGKTTALCKRLATETLIRRQPLQVLKVEADTPNPDDALRVFCEVMDVPFHHGLGAITELPAEETAFIDCPGLSLARPANWKALAHELDEFAIDSRVLVLNAAYDTGVLKRSLDAALEVGVSHLVLTHLDEAGSIGRLWSLLTSAGLPPVFCSTGPDVAGAHTEDTLGLLLERTFPRSLR